MQTVIVVADLPIASRELAARAPGASEAGRSGGPDCKIVCLPVDLYAVPRDCTRGRPAFAVLAHAVRPYSSSVMYRTTKVSADRPFSGSLSRFG